MLVDKVSKVRRLVVVDRLESDGPDMSDVEDATVYVATAEIDGEEGEEVENESVEVDRNADELATEYFEDDGLGERVVDAKCVSDEDAAAFDSVLGDAAAVESVLGEAAAEADSAVEDAAAEDESMFEEIVQDALMLGEAVEGESVSVDCIVDELATEIVDDGDPDEDVVRAKWILEEDAADDDDFVSEQVAEIGSVVVKGADEDDDAEDDIVGSESVATNVKGIKVDREVVWDVAPPP